MTLELVKRTLRSKTLLVVGNDIDPLDVGNDIGSCEEHVKVEDLVSDVGYNSDPLDVSIRSMILSTLGTIMSRVLLWVRPL